MPIHASWRDDAKAVITADFEDLWTISDFAQVLQDIRDMCKTVDHPVYAIATRRGRSGLPKGNLLPHFRRMFELPLAHIVTVPSSELSAKILSVLTGLSPEWQSKITYVKTIEEAEALVEQMMREQDTAAELIPS